jgi:shikimate kinase
LTLFLIGLRGAGKSTVGRLVATRLSAAFIDLDEETARRLGALSASHAFKSVGVDQFRSAEVQALSALVQQGPADRATNTHRVIALGGGTPTAPGAVGVLRSTPDAKVIYLRSSAAQLQSRLRADHNPRPSLTGADPIDEVPTVFAQRDDVYGAIADIVIETDRLTTDAVAALVVQALA